MKILTTAVFAVIILGRVLVRRQWFSLVLLVCGVALVQLANGESPGGVVWPLVVLCGPWWCCVAPGGVVWPPGGVVWPPGGVVCPPGGAGGILLSDPTRCVNAGRSSCCKSQKRILGFCVLTFYHWANYASPSSGEAYRDRQLTPNFELWVEFFCVPTCFHVRIPKPCLSVRTLRKKITNFVNITPTLVIDTSIERSSRVLHHGSPKNLIFFSKSSKLNSTCILTCAEELKSFK